MTATTAAAQLRYDRVSILLHWLIAGLIVANAALAFVAESFPREARGPYMNIHGILGALVLLLTFWRIANRVKNPAPPLVDRDWVVKLSKVGHGLLYLATIFLVFSGAMTFGFRGRPLDFGLFKIGLPLTPDKAMGGQAANMHETIFWVGTAVVVGHVVAALWHQFVWKDGVMNRMRAR